MNGIAERYEKRSTNGGLRYGIAEVTSRCQLRCPGCYMVRRNMLGGHEMSLSQAVWVLDLCREYRGGELETMDILGGEPLLWPHFCEYITILLTRGITPWVFTNMLAITRELAVWLREREIYVTGKLNIGNMADPEQLGLQAEMIGSSPAVARRMIEAIGIFQNAGYASPHFRLQNLIRKKTIHLVPEYYRWCFEHNIGVDVELMGSGEPIDEEYWKIAPHPAEIAEMIRKIQAIRREFDLAPMDVLMPHIFGSCPFFDKGLYFAANGTIRACSNSTPIVLSRLDDPDPVRKARESSMICNRLALTRARVGEPCHSCEKWERCRGGCRATVEGLGDPFGGYPLCPLPYL